MPEERLNYEVGDIVKLKKPHPCGSSEWEILRVGMRILRLKCTGLRAPDHGSPQTGGEEYKRVKEKRWDHRLI